MVNSMVVDVGIGDVQRFDATVLTVSPEVENTEGTFAIYRLKKTSDLYRKHQGEGRLPANAEPQRVNNER